ncbi:MAG: hypothetical protein QF375_00880 [Arenicellales bacterium]|nr:hypothetical protein [Arenicellales bacterium]
MNDGNFNANPLQHVVWATTPRQAFKAMAALLNWTGTPEAGDTSRRWPQRASSSISTTP